MVKSVRWGSKSGGLVYASGMARWPGWNSKRKQNMNIRRGSRINTDRFPKREPEVQAFWRGGGGGGVRGMRPSLKSPFPGFSESFRQDIGQFHFPRMMPCKSADYFMKVNFHVVRWIWSKISTWKVYLLKIYLLWKIWPSCVKRWKPVWMRAWTLYFKFLLENNREAILRYGLNKNRSRAYGADMLVISNVESETTSVNT